MVYPFKSFTISLNARPHLLNKSLEELKLSAVKLTPGFLFIESNNGTSARSLLSIAPLRFWFKMAD